MGTGATELRQRQGPEPKGGDPEEAPPHTALFAAASSEATQLPCVRAGLEHRQASPLSGEEKGLPSLLVRSGS